MVGVDKIGDLRANDPGCLSFLLPILHLPLSPLGPLNAMSPLLSSQSVFGFSNNAKKWLLAAVLLAIPGYIILLAAYYITYRRLESKRKWATTMFDALPPMLKERELEAAQDPQGHHHGPGITSEELAVSITL